MTAKLGRNLVFTVAALLILAMPEIGRTQPLTGTYTIGGTSPSYATFTAAVTALTTNGISGSVTFNVRAGTYTERIAIPAITGASASQTITFQSETGVASDVTLRYTPVATGDNSVIALNGASHIRIRSLTLTSFGVGTSFRSVIVLDATTATVSDVTIQGNTFNGAAATNGSADLSIIYGHNALTATNLTIANNTFVNGAYGIYIAGNGAASTGTVVRGNTFTGSYGGVYMTGQSAAIVDSNTLSVQYDGIDVVTCPNALSIQRNRVSVTAGVYGITTNNCQGTSLASGVIANNFVSIAGTNGCLGIYIANSAFQTVYYNSVNITSTGTSYAFYESGGSSESVGNNVFSNTTGSYAYYVTTPAAITTSDHNDLYGAGMVFLAHWGTTDCISLPALQLASGMDAHSVSSNPDFAAATDLHANSPWLDGTGATVGSVTIDIDGNPRNGSTPDIGANEFTSSLTKIAGGTYTIGGASPTYATFTAAVSDLVARGITGPVTMNVRAGTYAEQIDFWPVGGVSAANTITFQSETTGGVLQFTQSASNNNTNWVLRLNSASHVHLRNLALISFGLNTTYRNVLVLRGSVDDLVVQGDSLSGLVSANTSSQSVALIAGTGVWTRNMNISGNRFGQGSYGIYLGGYANTADTGTVIRANRFSSLYGGVYITNQPAVVADSNTASVQTDGIDINTCTSSISIQRNRITTSNGGYGIYLNNDQGDGLDFGVIANNFITSQGTSGAFGIIIQNSSYQNVYNNSVYSTTPPTSYTFYESGGSNLVIENNLFANVTGSYAYYVNTAAAVVTSDHNCYYGAGMVYLAHWGTTDCITLAALEVANGMDTHSVSSYPDVVSATDLHANSPWMDGTGTPLTAVPSDIDNHPRSVSTPDIGATEFTSSLTKLAGGTYTIGGASPTYATVNAAVSDLVARGVTGPVTLNVRPGSYTEQVDFWPVGGVSPANTITLQSESTVASLNFTQGAGNSATNWVLRLNAAGHVHVRNMTLASGGVNPSYRNVLVLNGSVDDLLVEGDSLGGLGGSANQSLALISGVSPWTRNLTIRGNRFGTGSYGVYISGYALSGDSGTVVKGNTFTNVYGGVYISTQPVIVVDSNSVAAASDGIDLSNCSASISVQRNRISTSAGGYGINLSNCQGDFLDFGLVANNFVATRGPSGGFGIILQNSSYQNIYYNSVNVTATGSGYGIYESGGGNINIVNNIFSNTGGFYAYYMNTPLAIASSDHNALYGAGMTFLARWGGADCISLAALQAANSMDSHSVSSNPDFTSATDLHANSPWLDGTGGVVSGVTVDIDGHPRSGTFPDIGASEFTSSLTKMPGGTYTIGGNSPSYATFAAAVNDLVSRGVARGVTLNVRPGTYTEQVDIWPIGGADAANPVTIQSETSGAVLQFAQTASNSATNWVMHLNSASHVHLKNMTLVSTGANTSYRAVLALTGSIDDLLVQGDSLGGLGGSSSTTLALIGGSSIWSRNLTIWGNRFGLGSYGVYLGGYGITADSGTVIKGNTFNGSYGGVTLSSQPAVVVDSNWVNVTYDGIDLSSCPASVSIQRNRVAITAQGYGVTLNSCQGDLVDYALIANNFIAVQGTSGGFGFLIQNSSYDYIYYNSVNMSSGGSSYACYTSGGSNLSLVDNIFRAGGGGYAYFVNTPAAITATDYNDITATGTLFARWQSTECANLAALQAASAMDAHSHAEQVLFASQTDLHLSGGSVGDPSLRGTPQLNVLIDIDGKLRNALTPYVGANEGSIVLPIAPEPPAVSGGIERAPAVFQLAQNFPNPFNPSTSVKFSVEKSGRAVMKLYDITGRQVATVFDGAAEPGRYYQVSINGTNLASGVYLYRLESGSSVALKKLILLK